MNSSEMPKCVIQLENVEKYFGEGTQVKTVLRSLSYDIRAGTVLQLKGDNGSGKSTLLNLIAGLDVPSSGRIRWSSTWSRRMVAKVPIRELAYMRQRPEQNLAVDLTVREHLIWGAIKGERHRWFQRAYGSRLHGRSIEYLKACSFPVELLRLTQRIRTLSGGQAQLCALAMTILQRPKIVLLDEPTAALDRENRNRFSAIVRTWRSMQGLTILFSTHLNARDDFEVTQELDLNN